MPDNRVTVRDYACCRPGGDAIVTVSYTRDGRELVRAGRKVTGEEKEIAAAEFAAEFPDRDHEAWYAVLWGR